MIVLRYRPPGVARSGEVLGLVGKAVTFDTGGISIKPSGGMEEMKLDMGGGAAVLEGRRWSAALGLPVEILDRDPRDGEHAERTCDQAGRRRSPR